jgi:cobalt-zinc-cadmium efflux system protein
LLWRLPNLRDDESADPGGRRGSLGDVARSTRLAAPSMSGTHNHSGHAHAVREDADTRRLSVALALIVGLMATEVVVGILAHSLALLSDAAHMLSDAGALLISLWVIRLLKRPAGGNLTFGLRRSEVLSAQANGGTLLVLAGLIVYEGIHRLVSPPPAKGLAILVVAVAGIGVNLLATWQLSRANRESMNIEGSFQHILTDLIAFVVTAIAGAFILAGGWTRADGVAALVIAGVMIRSAWGLLHDSGRVLLEAAPDGVEVEEIGRALAAHPHVESVHDLHVWQISSGFPSLSAHVLVHEGDDCHGIRRELEQLLRERFDLDHTTLQVDHASKPSLVQIGQASPTPHRH